MAEYIVTHGIRIGTNFVPETFGRLTTIGPRFMMPVGTQGKRTSYQTCLCSCGNAIVARTENLRSGRTRSCGCYNVEQSRIRGKQNRKHGRTDTAEFNIWQKMRYRCSIETNKNYPDYGGRGICVCDRWLEPVSGFSNFLADMGERPSKAHSIDRIDNNGNYCPENCRWATMKEQSRNRRSTTAITHNGKTQCIAAWEDELRINSGTLKKRLRLGWPVERALTQPTRVFVRTFRK